MSRKPQVWTRRHAIRLMGGLAGGIALHACTQQPQTSSTEAAPEAGAASSEPVSASNGSTLWIGYAPLYIAIEKGFFEEGGLDLGHKVMNSSGEADAAFAAGRLDSQNSVTSEVVNLAAKGQDFRIIQIADSSLGGDGILARNSIADIAGFRGQEIAVDVGGVSHFFLLQVLEEAGLSGDDVTITNLSPDAAAAAYQAGRINIAVTYSPFLKQADEAQPDGRIIFDTSQMPTAIMDTYVFSTQFVEENPQAAEAFVRGIFRAIEFMETDRDEALTIAGKMLGLTPEEVEIELQGVGLTSLEDNIEILGNPDSDIYLLSHLEELGQFLESQEQIPEAPTDLARLLEPTFVQAVQASA